jgi:hypothetical protein
VWIIIVRGVGEDVGADGAVAARHGDAAGILRVHRGVVREPAEPRDGPPPCEFPDVPQNERAVERRRDGEVSAHGNPKHGLRVAVARELGEVHVRERLLSPARRLPSVVDAHVAP